MAVPTIKTMTMHPAASPLSSQTLRSTLSLLLPDDRARFVVVVMVVSVVVVVVGVYVAVVVKVVVSVCEIVDVIVCVTEVVTVLIAVLVTEVDTLDVMVVGSVLSTADEASANRTRVSAGAGVVPSLKVHVLVTIHAPPSGRFTNSTSPTGWSLPETLFHPPTT